MNVPAEVFLETEASLKAIADSKGLTQYGDCRFAVAAFGLVDANNVVKTAAQLGGGGSGNISVIDLGIINAADVYAVGYIELLPAQVGRIIKGVYFLADNLLLDNASQIFFASGNDVNAMPNGASGGSGFAFFGQTFSDTAKQPPVCGDNGPLGLVAEAFDGRRTIAWTANTKVALGDQVIGSGCLQIVTTPGTTGSSEPIWDTGQFNDTIDGTVTWNNHIDTTTGWTATVHAIAEVITIPGLDIPRPTSFEFVQQPTDVVAGEAFGSSIQVKVLDQNGEPYIGAITNVRLVALGASLNPDTPEAYIDLTTGIATYDAGNVFIDVATPEGTYQLLAIFGGTNDFRSIDIRQVSDPFDVTAP